MFTEKENKFLNTFSSVSEFKEFSNNLVSFALGENIRNTINSTGDFIKTNVEKAGDFVKEGNIDPGTKLGNTLIGAGVGAGLGGLYGAFKKKKNKGDMLKYALIGAGVGGLGGLAGTYAKDAFDNYRLNSVENEILKLEQDPNASPEKIVELYNKRNELQKDNLLKIPAELGLAKNGYIPERADGGKALMGLAQAEFEKGNFKAAASLAKKAQYGSYGRNHPNFGKIGALPSDDAVLKTLAERKSSLESQLEKEQSAKLNQKINTKAGELSNKKTAHEKGRNWFEKLAGINEFKRNKHWPAEEKTEEQLLELLRGDDSIISDWAAEELAAKQLGI